MLNVVNQNSDYYLDQNLKDIIEGVLFSSPYKDRVITDNHLRLRSKIEDNPRIYGPLLESELSEFNELYLIRNMTKCLIAYQKIPLISKINHVKDLGCGPGSASIAFEILNQKNSPRLELKYSFIDKWKHQTNEAKRNFCTFFPEMDFTPQTNKKCTLTIASYSICEMLKSKVIMEDIFENLGSNFLVIDYGRVIAKLLNHDKKKYVFANAHSVTIELDARFTEIFGQNTLHVSFLHAQRNA